MKSLLPFIALCCLAVCAIAQQEETKQRATSFLHTATGPSFPVGEGSNSVFSSAGAGSSFAETGFGVTVGYGRVFRKDGNFGVSTHAAFHWHPVKDHTLDGPHIFIPTYELKSDPYMHAPLTVGLLIYAPVKRSAISVFIEGGAVISVLPEIDIENFVNSEAKAGVGGAFSTGFLAHIHLTEKLALCPSFQYAFFKPKFHDVPRNADRGPAITRLRDEEVKVHTLFAGVGVVIVL